MLVLAQKYYKNALDDDVNDMQEREFEGKTGDCRWNESRYGKEKRYQDKV